MPSVSGIEHKRAVRALQRAGFWVARQGKHITLTDGERIVTIPRADPINGYTMAGILKDAGISVEQFRDLL